MSIVERLRAATDRRRRPLPTLLPETPPLLSSVVSAFRPPRRYPTVVDDVLEIDVASPIGQGARGSVYGARSARGEKFIVKFVPFDEDDASIISYFLAEIAILQYLCEEPEEADPNVACPRGVNIIFNKDARDAEPLVWASYSSTRGTTIHDFVGSLTSRVARQRVANVLLSSLIENILFVHSRGVAHLDVKTTNAVVDVDDDNGSIIGTRLIDFDLSQVYINDWESFESFWAVAKPKLSAQILRGRARRQSAAAVAPPEPGTPLGKKRPRVETAEERAVQMLGNYSIQQLIDIVGFASIETQLDDLVDNDGKSQSYFIFPSVTIARTVVERLEERVGVDVAFELAKFRDMYALAILYIMLVVPEALDELADKLPADDEGVLNFVQRFFDDPVTEFELDLYEQSGAAPRSREYPERLGLKTVLTMLGVLGVDDDGLVDDFLRHVTLELLALQQHMVHSVL